MTYIEIEEKFLPIKELPEGNGWEIYSGNTTHNTWWRVVDKSSEEAPRALLHTGHFVSANGSKVLG